MKFNLTRLALLSLAFVALGCDCSNDPGAVVGTCPDGSFSCGQYCDDIVGSDGGSDSCGQACDGSTPCPSGYYCSVDQCTADCLSSGDAYCPDSTCSTEGVCEDPNLPIDGGTDGSPEICNGIDDDLDGKIDNIDVGGDGICDCLNIATLGIPGDWGGSNAFSAWLTVRGSSVTSLDDATLDAATLAPIDVIIVNDVTNDGDSAHGIDRAYSPAEVSALQTWIQNGGGVITLVGFWDTTINNVNLLMAPYSMSYGAAAILPGGGGTEPVEVWAGGHPLSLAITEIGVDNGHEPMGTGTIVASDMQTGLTVGLAQSGTAAVGEGKVFMWGDEWVTYDSLWNATDYEIEQFWVNVTNWLTPSNKCEIDVVIIE